MKVIALFTSKVYLKKKSNRMSILLFKKAQSRQHLHTPSYSCPSLPSESPAGVREFAAPQVLSQTECLLYGEGLGVTHLVIKTCLEPAAFAAGGGGVHRG
jgi:hypothetical protein